MMPSHLCKRIYFVAICGQGQGCLNGGRCIEPGRCACLFGYIGDMCEAGNFDI